MHKSTRTHRNKSITKNKMGHIQIFWKNSIAFRTKNINSNMLKDLVPKDKHNNSGIYQMIYPDCPQKYKGQTGRTFNIRYKEHIETIGNNNGNSGYSNHILNTGHT
jgi:hypothetical protein